MPMQAKVVMLGDISVGKSSIIQRYIQNYFTESVPSTVGASYQQKQITLPNNSQITLQIWDTAG